MEARMEHIKFFEAQANKNTNSSRNGTLKNNFNDAQKDERPKLKVITDDMPKWKRDKLTKENERIKEEIKQFDEREMEERRKWADLPSWKEKILKKKEALKKEKDEEEHQRRLKEEKERHEWESLPIWKQKLFEMRGISRWTTKFEENQPNHVTRADLDENKFDNSSDIPEDNGDNPEDSIGEDGLQDQQENGLEDKEINAEEKASEDKGQDFPMGDNQEKDHLENGDIHDDEAIENEKSEGKEGAKEVPGEQTEEFKIKMQEVDVPHSPSPIQ